jgi:hypothetical protein
MDPAAAARGPFTLGTSTGVEVFNFHRVEVFNFHRVAVFNVHRVAVFNADRQRNPTAN